MITTLNVNNYFEKYALAPCSSDLSLEDKVKAFAITFFATMFTGGLFLLGVAVYECCILSPNPETPPQPPTSKRPGSTSPTGPTSVAPPPPASVIPPPPASGSPTASRLPAVRPTPTTVAPPQPGSGSAPPLPEVTIGGVPLNAIPIRPPAVTTAPTRPARTLAQVFNDIQFLKFRVAGNSAGTTFFIRTTGLTTLAELRSAMIHAIGTGRDEGIKTRIETFTHTDDLTTVTDLQFDLLFFEYGDAIRISVKDENEALLISRFSNYPSQAAHDNHPSFFVPGLVDPKYVPELTGR